MGNQGSSTKDGQPMRFSDYYTTGERIGSGTFAVVKKCYRKTQMDQAFAVKIIDKKNLTARELVGLKYEVKILQTMEHPSVMKAVDVFEDKRKVKIVLELCEGGDLFDQMLKERDKRLSEKRAAWITCKLARALKYLHEHHVCHRDLKPENVLFCKNGNIKITDFGLAHYLKLPPAYHIMHTCCGTPHYVAPEVLGAEQYGVQVDFWSLGVILYIMLSGYQPFNSKSIRGMYSMITRGQYRFPRAHWDDISVEAISCVKGLMHLDPEKRLNYHTLSEHPFILNNVDLSELEKEEKLLQQEQQQLLEGSCSKLLPEGIRFPYDVHAREKGDFIDIDDDGGDGSNNGGADHDADMFGEAVNVKLTSNQKQKQQEKLLAILKEKEEKKEREQGHKYEHEHRHRREPERTFTPSNPSASDDQLTDDSNNKGDDIVLNTTATHSSVSPGYEQDTIIVKSQLQSPQSGSSASS